MESLTRLISRLGDPDAVSSAAPLLIVVGILVLYLGGLIFVILRTLRTPHRASEARVEFKRWNLSRTFNRFLSQLPKRKRRITSDISLEPQIDNHLLDQIAALKRENRELRAENEALSSRPPIPQQTQTPDNSAALEEAYRRLAIAEQTAMMAEEARKQATAKIEELEKNLKEVMSEIDNMYEQNAKALEQANTRRIKAQSRAEELESQVKGFLAQLRELYESGNSEKLPNLLGFGAASEEESRYRALCEEQARDLEKMKAVLKVAKEQIVSLSRRAA